jgi:hypothetical protein
MVRGPYKKQNAEISKLRRYRLKSDCPSGAGS